MNARSPTSRRLSVVVPFHRNCGQLARSLSAIRRAASALGPAALADLVVVADGAVDDPTEVARAHGARVLAIDGPRGPAVARNRGAEVCSGDVLVFVDTDVVVGEQALATFARLFDAQPDAGAAFGAYDEQPPAPGVLSQGRNLGHSFVHQRSSRDATTFWAGLGAVRHAAFAAVGGFDERFVRPSVEDIDLGYRLRAAGCRIVLDPSIQGTHLKRWTFVASVRTDIRDRGIPWVQLLGRYGAMRNDLNLTIAHRASVVAAYLLVGALGAAARWPALLVPAAAALLALGWLDRPLYRFLAARRGAWFAVRWFPFQLLHHLSNGVSFIAGTLISLVRRHMGIALPGALPATPWDPRTEPRVTRPA